MHAPAHAVRRCLVAIACGAAVTASARGAEARGVRVRGGAAVQGDATFIEDNSTLEVTANATDDEDTPLAGVWLDLRGALLSHGSVVACDSAPLPLDPKGDGVRVRTSSSGRACVRLRSAPEQGQLEIRFDGDALHGAAGTTVHFDRTRSATAPVELRFDQREVTLSLDGERVRVGVRASTRDGKAAKAIPLTFLVAASTERELAKTSTDTTGHAAFELRPEDLSEPGEATLKAVFSGDREREPSTATMIVNATSRVSLRTAEASAVASAGDDVVLVVAVDHARGPVSDGIVEAVLETHASDRASNSETGTLTTSAPVSKGFARLAIPIEPRARGRANLRVRYLASAPHLRPGAPLTFELTIAPPSLGARSWFIVVVGAAAAWVFSSWRRSREPQEEPLRPPTIEPGIHATADERPTGTYRGRVIDAHDGTPIEGAEIVVRRASLGDDGVTARAVTGSRGEFSLRVDGDRRDGFRIEARSRLHVTEARPLPAGGTLTVALITRRRALLERLARWTRRAGAPFDAHPDATPAEIRALASDRDDVARWSTELETAAFGAKEVDGEVEARVRDVEPR